MGSEINNYEAYILKFVDDTKAIIGVSNKKDVEDFQKTFNKLFLWQEKNNMKFNTTKFKSSGLVKMKLSSLKLIISLITRKTY